MNLNIIYFLTKNHDSGLVEITKFRDICMQIYKPKEQFKLVFTISKLGWTKDWTAVAIFTGSKKFQSCSFGGPRTKLPNTI